MDTQLENCARGASTKKGFGQGGVLLRTDLKHRLDLHAGLKKAESSLAIQMRSGNTGLGGWRKRDVKHVLVFCPERYWKQPGPKIAISYQQPGQVWNPARKGSWELIYSVHAVWLENISTDYRSRLDVWTKEHARKQHVQRTRYGAAATVAIYEHY